MIFVNQYHFMTKYIYKLFYQIRLSTHWRSLNEKQIHYVIKYRSIDIFLIILVSPSRTNDVVPVKHISVSPTTNIAISNDRMSHPMTAIIPRTNSNKSIPSDIESYRSTMLLPLNKNLLLADSSSYSSINEPSTASSYHTAKEDDNSNSGYKTPTPQADDETISSHSSISDLSHAETLEPNAEGN